VVALGQHIFRLGHAVEEGQTAAYLVVHLLEHAVGRALAPVLHPVVAERLHGAVLGQVLDLVHFHARCVLLEPLEDPVLVGVDDDGGEVRGRPLLGALLDEFEEVAAVLVVADQVGLVDDQNEGLVLLCAAAHSDLFQLVEGALDVEDGAGVTRAADGKQ
jgi:hypothetical protein